VNPKALTITANNQTKTYGSTFTFAGTEFSSSGLVNGDTVTSATLSSPGAAASATVATPGPTYTITPSAAVGTGLGNYTINYNNGILTVTPAKLTVTADNKTKQYGDPNPPFTYQITGFVNSETSSVVSGAPSFTTNPTATTASLPGPYSIVPGLGTLSAANYTFAFANGTLTITKREAPVAYIGQTAFFTSGTSSTTAQVTLSASVQDTTGSGADLTKAAVTFTDLLTGTVLASNVPVSVVQGSTVPTGTANTIVTLSSGKYGEQEYEIQVSLVGSAFQNCQQTGGPYTAGGNTYCPSGPAINTVSQTAYAAAHANVAVMVPPTQYSMQGGASVPILSTAAGKYGDATSVSYGIGMQYNNKGTNPQGQIQLMLKRPDGNIYYVKSNSITSLAFQGNYPSKDVTIYTKASIYSVSPSGTLTSIDGNVTLRVDAHEGCTTSPGCSSSGGDTIGFTVLSSKDGSLYYSNNWQYSQAILGWTTIQEAVNPYSAVVIN
jgi:hypothetical protein